MWYTYGIDPSNPTWRIDRARTQRQAMWASFAFFLQKADRFVLHYWPPDPDVAPLLAMDFQPEPTYVSPKARQLAGPLTPALRTLLFGKGEGQVPWFKVELERRGERLYYIEEHEDTAGWNCSAEELAKLYQSGVDPTVVMHYGGAAHTAPQGSRQLPLWRSAYTHHLSHPSRDEWVTAVRTVAGRASHFVFCWREEPPGANGWRSDYGKERLLPFATAEDTIDFPPAARQMVGVLSPEALEVICNEPPHGLPDLEHFGPTSSGEQTPVAPWWWLLLVGGQEILLRSHGNGTQVDLTLTPEEAGRLDQPPGRLYDLVLAGRRGRAWSALGRAWENRVRAARPDETVQHFGISTRYTELRCAGEAIASLIIAPAALDELLAWPDPGALLADAPAPAHLCVELCDGTVVWRQLEAPPENDVPWHRPR